MFTLIYVPFYKHRHVRFGVVWCGTVCNRHLGAGLWFSALSKTGLIGLPRCLAVEWGKHNITVNGISPTFIPTAINRQTLQGAFKEKLVGRTPLGRLGRPEDIVGTIVFLASDASDFITGQTIPIDGGWPAEGSLRAFNFLVISFIAEDFRIKGYFCFFSLTRRMFFF